MRLFIFLFYLKEFFIFLTKFRYNFLSVFQCTYEWSCMYIFIKICTDLFSFYFYLILRNFTLSFLNIYIHIIIYNVINIFCLKGGSQHFYRGSGLRRYLFYYSDYMQKWGLEFHPHWPHKSSLVIHIVILVLVRQRQEDLWGSLVGHSSCQVPMRGSFSKNKVDNSWGTTSEVYLWPLHSCAHMCI